MLSDRLRQQLEQLHRHAMPRAAESHSAPPIAVPSPDPNRSHDGPTLNERPARSFALAHPAPSADKIVRYPPDDPTVSKLRLFSGEPDSKPDTPNPSAQHDLDSLLPSSVPASIDALTGEEIQGTDGSHWLIRQSLDQVWPHCRRYLNADGTLAKGTQNGLPSFGNLDSSPSSDPYLDAFWTTVRSGFPRETLLLDLETCGLAGSTIFLAGLIHLHEGTLVLSQLWARHYGEEKALLQTLMDLASPCHTLVTFNGKSFDWPQVVDRCTLHHLALSKRERSRPRRTRRKRKMGHLPEPTTDSSYESLASRPLETDEWYHCDLLHLSRRRWRGRVPNCRLQTLERLICGRNRVDDLPSREIPQAYHDYVRNGQLDRVPAILHHNALDLVTLLQLLLVFLREEGTPAIAKH